jgi:hypothetical protein
MKTLKLLVALVLFLGSTQMGLAQSNSIPKFNSEAEKQAWIKANPEEYRNISSVNSNASKTTKQSASAVRVATPANNPRVRAQAVQPQAELPANAVKSTTVLSGAKGSERPSVKRVDNTKNALPANYKPVVQESKTSDQ